MLRLQEQKKNKKPNKIEITPSWHPKRKCKPASSTNWREDEERKRETENEIEK